MRNKALSDLGKKRMHKLVKWGADYMRKLIATPGPPVSRPGKPPNVDSGLMYSSIKTRVWSTASGATGTIENVAVAKGGRPYPLFLEVGRDTPENIMKPRPFISTTMTAMQQQAPKIMLKKFSNADYQFLKARDVMLKELGKDIQQPRLVIRI